MTNENRQLTFSFVYANDAMARSTDDIAYLLNCYDVWSATPSRGCECGARLAATD